MTNIELAKKTLDNIQSESFRLDVDASTGGICSDDWEDSLDLYLSREQLLYLINERNGHKELFEGLTLEKVDVDSIIADMTRGAAWPDGGPYASVNEVVPNELSELSEELETLDCTDDDAVKVIREKLRQVSDGKYTFYFTVEASGYYFTENAEKCIELSAKEALGILYGQHEIDKVFEGICDESYDEDLINDKAKKLGFAKDYDRFSYGGECEQLEAYINAWDYILDSIMSEEITEKNLDLWLMYFDDTDNYEFEIDKWHGEEEEYEEEDEEYEGEDEEYEND